MSDKPRKSVAQPTLNQRLAANISAGRKSLGITQEMLAERLGVETETVSRFERGVSTPSLKTIEKMCQVLGVTPASMLSEPTGAPVAWAEQLTRLVGALPASHRAFVLGMVAELCQHLLKEPGAKRAGRKG